MGACAVEMHMDISQEPFYARIYKEKAVPQDQDRDQHFVQACSIKMHMDISRTLLCENSQGKSRGPRSGEPRFADFVRACHGHLTREILCENLAEKMEHPDLAAALAPTVRGPQCGHTVLGKHPGTRYHWPCQTHF